MIPTGGTITRHTELVPAPSRTWKLDLERGRVTGMIDGLEAVRQAVFLILQTERFRHLIYSSDYGMEWNGLIGAAPALVRAELTRRITEALLQDDRIEDVTDFQIDAAGDHMTVRFTVISSYGNFEQEVSLNV